MRSSNFIVFTRDELKDLFFSWVLLSLAFAVLFYNGSFIYSFVVSLLVVGSAFVFHELAHKFVAFRFGCSAFFKANYTLLFLAVFMSFFGFIFASPGAVVINGFLTRKRSALISLAGPLANLFFALLFIPFFWITPSIAFFGFSINSWLALFNLLPIPGFDGFKVFLWNKYYYSLFMILAVIMSFIAYFL